MTISMHSIWTKLPVQNKYWHWTCNINGVITFPSGVKRKDEVLVQWVESQIAESSTTNWQWLKEPDKKETREWQNGTKELWRFET